MATMRSAPANAAELTDENELLEPKKADNLRAKYRKEIEAKKDAYLRLITPANFIEFKIGDFYAKVPMNPRDAMVLSELVHLPDDFEEQVAALTEFRICLHNVENNGIGGKTALRIHPKCNLKEGVLERAGFKNLNGPNTKFMDEKATKASMSRIETHPKSTKAMQHVAEFEKGENGFKFIRLAKNALPEFEDKKEEAQFFEDLFQFKKIHSGFVTQAKIDQGLYSSLAEKLKVTNEIVEEFVVTKDNKIVATFMLAMQGDIAYVADFIVHQDFRKDYIAEAMCYKSFKEMDKLHPEINKGVWFISGGDGLTEFGKYLYGTVFQSMELTEELQNKLGLFLNYGAPGPVLCKAANREPKPPFKSLDKTLSSLSAFDAPAAPEEPKVHEVVAADSALNVAKVV